MINKNDLKWKIIFSLFVVVITSAPYYVACSQDGNWIFSGFLFGTEDGNSYIAKMLLGASGKWLFTTPYTAEFQSGFLAFLPYMLLGKLSSPGERHAQLIVLFHLFRTAGIFLYVFSVYDFVSYFISGKFFNRVGVIFASFGGGIGWLSIVGLENLWSNQLPLEFYSPESFGFLSLYGLPHLAFARALMLWGILNFLKAENSEIKRIYLLKSSIFLFLIGFFQPLTVAVGLGLILVYTGYCFIIESLKEKDFYKGFIKLKILFRNSFAISVLPGLWVIYNYISFSLDPFLKVWQKQNIIESPPPLEYIWAYLLLIPFLVGGLWNIIKKRKQKYHFLLVWFFCFPFLAYAPYNLQRRLPEGIWICIIICALLFISEKKINKFLVQILMGFSILPQLIILAAGVQLANNPAVPIFRPADEVNAFIFLAEHTNTGDVVLSSYESSNPLPAWAAVRTLSGHGPESVNLEKYENLIKEFFSETTDQYQREKILDSNGVNFVFWGPNEMEIGKWDPQLDQNLNLIYDLNNYKIFSVK